MAISRQAQFSAVLSAAINDLMEHGFDSQERLDRWLMALQAAARTSLIPQSVLVRTLQGTLGQVYARTTKDAKLLRMHPGVSQFTIHNVKPKLRAELDRRKMAAVNLIKLNRDAMIGKMVQRFAGWASSVPIGGTEIQSRKKVKDEVRRGLASLPFSERKCLIDQGHKMVASINEIIAVDGGAVAAEWRHVHKEPGYDPRPEHVARNGKVFLLRDSWAVKDGLVKLAGRQYTDQVEQPAELVFCRCWWSWRYTLRDLPPDMLTAKGKSALMEARAKIRSFA